MCIFIYLINTICAYRHCRYDINNKFKECHSPRAARLVDINRCLIAFDTLKDLWIAYQQLDKCFRICGADNLLMNFKHPVPNNFRYINVYILFEDHSNRFTKLVCEIRLTLQIIRDLDEERKLIQSTFDKVLNPEKTIQLFQNMVQNGTFQ